MTEKPPIPPRKPPLFRIRQCVVDLTRVGAVFWPHEGERYADYKHDYSDSYPTLEIWLTGGAASPSHPGRANLTIRDVPEELYEAFIAAWESAR